VEYAEDESYAKGEQLAVVAAREGVSRDDLYDQLLARLEQFCDNRIGL